MSLQQTAAIPATWSSIYYDVGELWNAVTVGTRSRFRSGSAYLKTKNRSQAAAGPAEKHSVALKTSNAPSKKEEINQKSDNPGVFLEEAAQTPHESPLFLPSVSSYTAESKPRRSSRSSLTATRRCSVPYCCILQRRCVLWAYSADGT